MELSTNPQHLERRRYCRISTVFPVIFSVYKNPKEVLKRFQGFTRDISEDGICLELNDLDPAFSEWLREHYLFRIDIEVPFQKNPISSEVFVAWRVAQKDALGLKHSLGMQFKDTELRQRKTLFQYATRNRLQPYFIIGTIILLLLILFSLYNSFIRVKGHLKIQTEDLNKARATLKQLQSERSFLNEQLKISNKRYYFLETKLQKNEEYQKKLKQNIRNLEDQEKETQQSLPPTPSEKQKYQLELEETRRKAADYLHDKWQTEIELKRITKEKEDMKLELSRIVKSKEEMENALSKLNTAETKVIYELKMKNGLVLTGELIEENNLSIELRIGRGIIMINKENVDRIREIPIKNLDFLKKTWTSLEKEVKTKPMIREFKPPTFFPKGKIECKGKRIYIGGKLFYVKGVAYGIEYPKCRGGMQDYEKIGREVFEKDFKMMKEAGINTIRTYEPLNIRLLDLAKEYGIKVIENIAYPCNTTDFSSDVHLSVLLDQALDTIFKHRSHEAILMWSLWNDAPWVWGAGGSPFEQYSAETISEFMKKLYTAVKKADPHHPVTASNVLGFKGSDLGFDYLDVLGFNTYLGGIGGFVQEDGENDMQKLIALSEKYNKPVIILETGFSTFGQNMDQGEIIGKQIKIVGENLAGLCIFQWADGWNKAGFKDEQNDDIEEHWGVLTGYRYPKSGYNILSRYFNVIPTESKGYLES